MDLTIVVPTRNEEANVDELAERAERALAPEGLSFEILFVDDSDDRTPEAVEHARGRGRPVRLMHRRPGERSGGLSGAVLAGFEVSRPSDLLAVIDGDLQHPPEVLPRLLDAVRDGADMAVGSRFVTGGGDVAGLAGPSRRAVSRATRRAARLAVRPARAVRDPLSGCFLVRRAVVTGVPLEASGFKLLLEVLARGRWSRVTEVPMHMATRAHGTSNAGWREGVRYARQLVRLRRGVSSLAGAGGPRGL